MVRFKYGYFAHVEIRSTDQRNRETDGKIANDGDGNGFLQMWFII